MNNKSKPQYNKKMKRIPLESFKELKLFLSYDHTPVKSPDSSPN